APPGPSRQRRPVAERRGLGGPSRPPSTSVKLPAMKCAGCGQDNPEGARFCNACGARLDAAPVQAPRAYTPRHLVEKILTSRAALEGERKQVTVLYAALRMQDRVSRWADEVQRLEGLSVRIRVGLNSGEVVVRSIANDLRMDYTAVGQTTHLAARMEQMAVPGTILITPGTLRLAES